MNPSTVLGLARALQVPPGWLIGELDSLPFVPKHGLLSGKRPEEPEDVTQTTVRLSHLLARVDAAVRADLTTWFGDAADLAYQSWGWALLEAIGEVASPVTWRVFGVVPRSGDPGVWLTIDNAGPIAWLEQALKPWFEGAAYLNASAFHELLQALFQNPRRAPYASITDTDMLRALRMYDAVYTGSQARRVLRSGRGRVAKRRRK